MSQPFPTSLCHACNGCRVVLSGRGSVFLRCDRRAERYLPQPVRACPVYAPRPLMRARSAGGDALIAGVGAPLAVDARVTAAGLVVEGRHPARPPEGVAAGDAVLWRPDGFALSAEPARGPVLGWVLTGRAALFGLPVGARVRFEPAD